VPGRDAARPGKGAVKQLGADAGPDGGDAAGTGGGEPLVPEGPPRPAGVTAYSRSPGPGGAADSRSP